MPGHSAYCMRCRAHRAVHGGRIVRHGLRHRLEGGCASCGGRVSSFVSAHGAGVGGAAKHRKRRGKGIFGSLLGSVLPF